MKTRRLYHEDPDLLAFEAVTRRVETAPDGRCRVILDRTAFYPTGGGQPHDTGVLAGLPVLEVEEQGEEVVHWMEGPVPEGRVRGTVDAARRRDHRQQHTGQHILSRALLDRFGAATVGFHLGAERCTIDLDRELSWDDLLLGETQANEIVQGDLPVGDTWYDDADAVPEAARKEAAVEGPVRILSIGSFDATPCCGTHCTRTGQVGLVKLLRRKKNKGGVRVEFVCGERARLAFVDRHHALRDIAALFSGDELEAPEQVRALLAEKKQLERRLDAAETELREQLLERWTAEPAPADAPARDVGPEREAWLPDLARALAEGWNVPVLVYSRIDDQAAVAAAAPPGHPAAVGPLLGRALAGLGGKGGGRPDWGRGRLPVSALDRLLASWPSLLEANP